MMKLGLFLAIVLASGIATLAEAVEVKATSDSGLQILESVFRVHNLFDEKNDVTVRLFETGGGDPAINGDILLLTIIPGNREQAALTWNTSINVYTVDSAGLDPEHPRIIIEVREHFAGTSGEIKERPQTYIIEYEFNQDTGALSDIVRLLRAQPAERNNEPERPSQPD